MQGDPSAQRLIVAITGASGAVYGVRLLQKLPPQVESHLVISDAGALTLYQELGLKRREVEQMASHVYGVRDIGALIASGSVATKGMVVAPCSMNTLGQIAHGLADSLIGRAADVVLKERRRLVLMVRETPLTLAHLRNMTSVTEMGGVVFPPLPAFYARPKTLDEAIDHTVGRVLDLFGIEHSLGGTWSGLGGPDTGSNPDAARLKSA